MTEVAVTILSFVPLGCSSLSVVGGTMTAMGNGINGLSGLLGLDTEAVGISELSIFKCWGLVLLDKEGKDSVKESVASLCNRELYLTLVSFVLNIELS